jgi:hypothetical protein
MQLVSMTLGIRNLGTMHPIVIRPYSQYSFAVTQSQRGT